MNRMVLAAIALPFLVAPSLAEAQPTARVEAGVTAGTLGVGPELNFRYGNWPVGLRFGFSAMNLNLTRRIDDISYKAGLSAESLGPTLDLYPFGSSGLFNAAEILSGFHLSGGFRAGSPRVRLRATPGANTTVDIGNSTYTGAEVGQLRGKLRYGAVQPYVGAGMNSSFFDGRLVVTADLGALVLGSPRTSLSATGPIANDPDFRTDLASQNQKLHRSARLPVYPMASLGLRYAFNLTGAQQPVTAGRDYAASSPAPAPVVAAPVVRTYVIYFNTGSAVLDQRARDVVVDAVRGIRSTTTTRIEIAGHADRAGGETANQALSLRRAEAVRAELVRAGVRRDEMTMRALGETQPAVATADGVAEARNRRVEVVAN